MNLLVNYSHEFVGKTQSSPIYEVTKAYKMWNADLCAGFRR